jgi:hypothetical protein
MKIKSLIPAIAVISLWILWSLVLSPAYLTVSAQGPFLADRHGAKGMNCVTCHKESPPAEKAPSAACIGCHGDNKKVAEKTAKLYPNPHESHLGEVDCQTCHHAHKASELSCAACHDKFDMKVP